MTRLARFGSSLAIFGFAVGVVAGVIVPVLEFGFNVNTVSRLLPRQYGVLLAAGAVIMFVLGSGGAESLLGIIGASAFGLGWASLGVALLDPPAQTSRP